MNKANLIEKWVDNELGSRQAPFHMIKKSRYPEIRTYCPICLGGAEYKDYQSQYDFSFDIHVEDGVCRCWRASCGWADSIESLVMELYGVNYKKAKEILYGDFDDNFEQLKFNVNNLPSPELNESTQPEFESLPSDTEKVSSFNVSDGIKKWLTGRGYDVRKFIRKHDLHYPPENVEKFKGRVLFGVNTLDRRSYLAYSYTGVEPKTLNPTGKTLSRMLFNYEKLRFNEPDYVFITEGVFDACRLISFGLKAVCVFGVHPSAVQCELLSNLEADEYAICFDNGAEEKMHDFKDNLLNFVSGRVSVININEKDYVGNDFEEGLDPDDLSKKEFVKFFKERKVFKRDKLNSLKTKVNKLNV